MQVEKLLDYLRQKSKSGKNLDTYISKNLQEYCFKQLQGKVSVVVMNVNSEYNFTVLLHHLILMNLAME